MRKLLLLLLVLPLAYAAGWESTAAAAILISAGFLGVAFAVGMGFGVSELQIMAKEEAYQLIATGILVVLLVGTDNLLNGISGSLGSLTGATDLQDGANVIIDDTLHNAANGLEVIYTKVTALDNSISTEGSKTMSCSIVSIGFTVSSCGGYSMLNAPLSMGGSILGFAIGELYSMKRLIAISDAFSLNLLLPIGLLLRTFKLSRGAGGFLIAMAVSMHILLPAGMIFNQVLVDTFLAEPGMDSYVGSMSTSVPACDPGQVAFGDGSANPKQVLGDLRADLGKIMFSVLVKGTFGPVISLLMMAGGIRALSSLAGAEVDVSALGRFI